MHVQCGGICEQECQSSSFRCMYTTASYSFIHSIVKWSSQVEEQIPWRDGHLHGACKLSFVQAMGWGT